MNKINITLPRLRNLQIRWIYFFFSLLSIFHFQFSFSQQSQHSEVFNYARKIVDTLASPSMHGRGYVSGGDSIAAKYIADRFLEFGLKDLLKIDDKVGKGNYYQHFSFPVNTFPDTSNFLLSLEGKRDMSSPNDLKNIVFKGRIGKNFLFTPDCPSASTTFNVSIFDSLDASSEKKFKKFVASLNAKKYETIVIIDERKVKDKKKLAYFDKIKTNYFNGLGVGEVVDKLTADVSFKESENLGVQILSDSFHVVEKRLKGWIFVKANFIPNHKTQNIIGYIPGTQYPDSFIVFTAHYDHLGVMGHDDNGKEVYFPGANDNASGCAMLLSLAKYYSQHPPKYSIAFMAFGGEEVGLLGSKYYTEHPLFPLNQIKFLVNFDIVGTGDEGIKVVNATEFPAQFKQLQQLNSKNSYLKEVSPRGKAAISDHYFFTEKGVKCFYIYTLGGIKAYHDIYDRPETLPLTKFEELYKLMIDFTRWLQVPK